MNQEQQQVVQPGDVDFHSLGEKLIAFASTLPEAEQVALASLLRDAQAHQGTEEVSGFIIGPCLPPGGFWFDIWRWFPRRW